MKYLIIVIACLLLIFQFYTIKTVIQDIESLQQVKEIPYKKNIWVKGEIIQMIANKAIKNDLNPKYLIKLVECESNFNPTVRSKGYLKSGKQEYSIGLTQINLDAHKISLDQAKDPEFNVEWAIKHIKAGKAPQMWVKCHQVANK